MSIINKEYDRWYKKIWARRKSAGLSTKNIRKFLPKRITKLVKEPIHHNFKTKEETLIHKRKTNKICRDKKRIKRNNIRKKYLSTHCYICKREEYKLLAHRKDGTRHKDFCTLTAKNLETELLSGKYINLCYACHKGVHWSMENFGYNWEQILKKIKKT